MQLFNHQTGPHTEFSFTKEGNYMKTIIAKDFIVMKCTPNPGLFLEWMVSDEVQQEQKKEEEQLKLLKMISSWELHKAYECFRGSFNHDHYKKVLNYKSVMFSETFSETSRIPKVKLKTVYPDGTRH